MGALGAVTKTVLKICTHLIICSLSYSPYDCIISDEVESPWNRYNEMKIVSYLAAFRNAYAIHSSVWILLRQSQVETSAALGWGGVSAKLSKNLSGLWLVTWSAKSLSRNYYLKNVRSLWTVLKICKLFIIWFPNYGPYNCIGYGADGVPRTRALWN